MSAGAFEETAERCLEIAEVVRECRGVKRAAGVLFSECGGV
jgi:aspartyl/asparaginyl beta-hydroxylase (cupin superfamily)